MILFPFTDIFFIKRSHADNFLSVCQLSGSKSQPVSDIVFIYRMQIERISYIDCHSHCRVGQIQGLQLSFPYPAPAVSFDRRLGIYRFEIGSCTYTKGKSPIPHFSPIRNHPGEQGSIFFSRAAGVKFSLIPDDSLYTQRD